MAGAAVLAGLAALRGGAGLVRLAVPDVVLDTVAGCEPSYMTLPLPSDGKGRLALCAREHLVHAADSATVVACGPGLGRSDDLNHLVHILFAAVPKPMVLDADALNALATWAGERIETGGPRILTPHPGEARRLLGKQPLPANERVKIAATLAHRYSAIVVLKGHRTVITDGSRFAVNTTGNPGMATGGSGDVLTGLITALACQGLPPFDAAQLGVYLHGLAGDLAAGELGQEAMIASDLIRFLPAAFAHYRSQIIS